MWKKHERHDRIRVENMYTLFERIESAGYSFDGESHDFWEMLYIADGSATVTADRNIYFLDKGSVIFHKPLEFHKYTASTEDSTHTIVMSFDISGEYVDFFKHLTIRLDTEQISMLKGLVEYCKTHSGKCPENIGHMYLTNWDSSEEYSQTVCSMADLFLLSLHKPEPEYIDPVIENDALLFNKVVEIMQTNASSFMTINEFAEKSNTSTSKLKNLFIKCTGLPIHTYYLQVKLIQAKRMLARGCSVAQTAHDLGFCSQYYFSTVFKRELGITPTKYSKSYRIEG